MRNFQLFNNEKKESQRVVSHPPTQLIGKSDIKAGMTTNQIANVISDRLISHVDKALQSIKKK